MTLLKKPCPWFGVELLLERVQSLGQSNVDLEVVLEVDAWPCGSRWWCHHFAESNVHDKPRMAPHTRLVLELVEVLEHARIFSWSKLETWSLEELGSFQPASTWDARWCFLQRGAEERSPIWMHVEFFSSLPSPTALTPHSGHLIGADPRGTGVEDGSWCAPFFQRIWAKFTSTVRVNLVHCEPRPITPQTQVHVDDGLQNLMTILWW